LQNNYIRPQFIWNCNDCGGDFESKGKKLLCPDCFYVSQKKSKRIKRIKILEEGQAKRLREVHAKYHAKYLERKEKARRLRELNKNKLIVFCSNCKEPFAFEKYLKHVISGRCSTCRGWNYDKNLFNYFKSIMFGKNHNPNNIDKEIIRTRVRLFKIQRKEEKTDETNRI